MALPTLAIPGQTLGPTSKYAPGTGTHIHNAHLCASVVGPVAETKSTKRLNSTTHSPLPTLEIRHPSLPATSTPTGTHSILPSVDSIVLARVTRLTPRQATVAILVINDVVCREGFQGIIRAQDVRATEKDRVKMGESFRVGDIIRGVVISLGDQSSYYLSTARNELGVVMAWSREGRLMAPVSWREVRDLETGVGEERKVAKPF